MAAQRMAAQLDATGVLRQHRAAGVDQPGIAQEVIDRAVLQQLADLLRQRGGEAHVLQQVHRAVGTAEGEVQCAGGNVFEKGGREARCGIGLVVEDAVGVAKQLKLLFCESSTRKSSSITIPRHIPRFWRYVLAS